MDQSALARANGSTHAVSSVHHTQIASVSDSLAGPSPAGPDHHIISGVNTSSSSGAPMAATIAGQTPTPPPTGSTSQAGPSVRRSARQPAPQIAVAPSTPLKASKRSTKALQHVPVDDSKLCLHLPEADEAALNNFVRLETCTYQNRSIGLAKTQEDNFTCECRFDPDRVATDPTHHACGEESGCINRLTQVECDPSECRTKHLCQNQRIQRREVAPIKIVQTEKKGCGVMANADLPPDLLISEYIGEVIGHSNFLRRIRDYGEEGIKHFYFMALQRDEYIDATKKGGLGRFLNHSCEPNCYVAKWVVGKRLRMAIFTKRPIRYGEELTFNYNVDRYGHDAQECFCGEPTCVGTIGGKTQTDIGIMDELFLDALGIAEEVEQLQLKGTKKGKKSYKLDEDYIPVMREMTEEEVPTVASAIRQAVNNKRILTKLLARVVLSHDPKVQNQLMRLRGFSLMTMVLDEYGDDYIDIVVPVLQIFLKWPLIAKNKVANTNAEELVNKVVTESPEEQAVDLANQCLAQWNQLEMSYRIPVSKDADISESEKRKRSELLDSFHSFKRSRAEEATPTPKTPEVAAPSFAPPTKVVFRAQLPPRWSSAVDSSNGRTYYFHEETRTPRWSVPTAAEAAQVEEALARDRQRRSEALKSKTFEEIMSGINEAEQKRKQKQEEDASAMEMAHQALKVNVSGGSGADAVAKPLSLHKSSKKRKHGSFGHGSSKKSSSGKSGAKTKEQEALKLFTPVVIGVLSKYARKALDRDQFKKRAKELSHLLVEKEKKSSRWDKDDYTTLAPEKEKKLRAYCKDWVAKLIARKGGSSSSSKSKSPSKSTASTPITTQGDGDGEKDDEAMEKEMADLMAEMNGVDEDGEDDEDGNDEAEGSPESSERQTRSTTPAGHPNDSASWVPPTTQLQQQELCKTTSAESAAPPPPPPDTSMQMDVDGEAALEEANAEATMTLEEADMAVEATQQSGMGDGSVAGAGP